MTRNYAANALKCQGSTLFHPGISGPCGKLAAHRL